MRFGSLLVIVRHRDRLFSIGYRCAPLRILFSFGLYLCATDRSPATVDGQHALAAISGTGVPPAAKAEPAYAILKKSSDSHP